MKRLLIGVAAACALAPGALADTQIAESWTLAALCHGAGTALASEDPAAGGSPPVLLEGFGGGGFHVTQVAAAQRWFDQGMATGFAFSHAESLRAFMAAQQADPGCAMCAWGEAYAVGPTLNFGVDAAARRRGLAALDRAAAMAPPASEAQRGLLAAMRLRYAAPDTDDRTAADLDYANAMDRLAARFPEEESVQILAADALMLSRFHGPEELLPQEPQMNRAKALLEGVLARNPNSTGAIHWYIHLTEIMEVPGLAESAADRLGALAPAAGHLIHMPSHTYGRIGRWRDAALVNRLAQDADARLAERTRLTAAAEVPYHAHNMAFRTLTATASGDRREALAAARDVFAQYGSAERADGVRATAYQAIGRWGDAATLASTPAASGPSLLMRRYAAGEIAARAGDRDGLRREISAVADFRRDIPEGEGADRRRKTADLLRLVLEARLSALRGRMVQSAERFREASVLQRDLGLLGDPPFLWFNTRRAEGQAWLRAGRLDQARAALTTAMREWPGDAAGLAALWELESRQGHAAAAAERWRQASAAWAGDPADLTSATL